jgi:hypothetical protein
MERFFSNGTKKPFSSNNLSRWEMKDEILYFEEIFVLLKSLVNFLKFKDLKIS